MIQRIKHIAVAVSDVDSAVGLYEQRLGIQNPRRVEWEKGRVARGALSAGRGRDPALPVTGSGRPLRPAHRPPRRGRPSYLPGSG